MKLLLVTILVLCVAPTVALCQAPPTPEEEGPIKTPPARPSPAPNRHALVRRWVYEYRFSSSEKKLLEPSELDLQESASFLRFPDTGLIRLYPWTRRRRVISVEDLGDGRTPDFGSHACLFSFSKNKYGNALNGFVDPRLGWAELKLVDGRFFTGFTGESLGVLVALGDKPLETITPESDGVTGLTNITPPADFIEASILSRRNRAGFQMDKFNYGSSLPSAASMTYVLRSTSNKRADILVGFRVLRMGTDGSVTILWRKLKSYPKPDWKRFEE